jgi:Protein of unknown function (DUF3833)
MKRRSIIKLGAGLSLSGGTLATLNGCASTDPSVYAKEQPPLDLKTYFNGTIDAWGLFQDRSGQVIKRFTVVMNCTWQGNQGVLDEDFSYSDGTKQKRIWRITETAPGQFTGKADDVVGEAIGRSAGNAFNWRYVLALPVDGTVYNVNFDDWMYLIDNKIMINKAVMSKFGFRLGEVLLSFTKR